MHLYHPVIQLLKHRRNQGNSSIIGDCFLERGSSMMLVGSSGAGKSKSAQALAAALATGSEFVGIRPNGEFRVLYIQTEDTVDDMAESFQGYAAHDLENDEALVKILNENLTVMTVVGTDGLDFLRLVDELCEKHTPDVVIVDPLLAFIGCDVVDQRAVTTFLRGNLRPILLKHNCGFIGVHHSRKDKGGPGIDQAIGAMEFAAFFRGVINLIVKEDRHREVTLKAVKRQRQLGWVDAQGSRTDTKYMLKAEDGVYFTEVSDFAPGAKRLRAGRRPKADLSKVADFIKGARSAGVADKVIVEGVAKEFGYCKKQAQRHVQATEGGHAMVVPEPGNEMTEAQLEFDPST
jgi:RecA-family ATPase